MNEEWRLVLGGDYEVSNLGRVRRARSGRKTWAGRLMAPVLLKIGYLSVSPTVNGKNRQTYVHRMVAEAFLGPCPIGHEVNHKDGNKANPALNNLEYVTHRENGQHAARTGLCRSGERHPGAKLTDRSVAEIRAARAAGESGTSVARRFGVSPATISQIHTRSRRAA